MVAAPFDNECKLFNVETFAAEQKTRKPLNFPPLKCFAVYRCTVYWHYSWCFNYAYKIMLA